ncbi:MAG TPA: nucleotidyltransferase domain-containing protein [Terriglobia bacterium]|nr:nucleotidyltransferase domain-containing protein [Terriglobia bacterium]
MDSSVSSVVQLEERLGTQFVNIKAAREFSRTKRTDLTEKLKAIPSGDASIVVSGSLARDEFTEGSDTDWTLLVDGSADPEHTEIVKEVGRIIAECTAKPVGREGTFGTLTFSHNLIQQIGGEADTNRNTTQRILLLLESRVLGRDDAYERVIKNVLRRYILEDHGFIEKRGLHHVPRFLLNDFARYWWTMAVDFAYKQRTRDGKGAAIRNVKLRMSRKLIYVSGLLTCFGCALRLDRFGPIMNCVASDDRLEYVDLLRRRLRPPLDVLAETLLQFTHLDSEARKLFSAYDGFLKILSDRDSRNRLEGLDVDKYECDEIYRKARELSHEFRKGLIALFFDEKSGLGELTQTYGVF